MPRLCSYGHDAQGWNRAVSSGERCLMIGGLTAMGIGGKWSLFYIHSILCSSTLQSHRRFGRILLYLHVLSGRGAVRRRLLRRGPCFTSIVVLKEEVSGDRPLMNIYHTENISGSYRAQTRKIGGGCRCIDLRKQREEIRRECPLFTEGMRRHRWGLAVGCLAVSA